MPDSYQTIARLDDKDGVSAQVTRRLSNIGVMQYSFKFYRTYPQLGEIKQTAWLNPRHLPAIQRLTVLIGEQIQRDKDREPPL